MSHPQGDIFAVMNANGMQVVNGKLKVPDKPELGITLVDEVLREKLGAGEVYWDS